MKNKVTGYLIMILIIYFNLLYNKAIVVTSKDAMFMYHTFIQNTINNFCLQYNN